MIYIFDDIHLYLFLTNFIFVVQPYRKLLAGETLSSNSQAVYVLTESSLQKWSVGPDSERVIIFFIQSIYFWLIYSFLIHSLLLLSHLINVSNYFLSQCIAFFSTRVHFWDEFFFDSPSFKTFSISLGVIFFYHADDIWNEPRGTSERQFGENCLGECSLCYVFFSYPIFEVTAKYLTMHLIWLHVQAH